METEKPYSVNEHAERVMGRRLTPAEEKIGVVPFNFPCELGYWCPYCRIEWDEGLEWSEYACFLWCARCDFDWPSALCVRVDVGTDPDRHWMHLGREAAVKVFLDTVGRAAEIARLRHELDLIRTDVGGFQTDCSTPVFQMVRNAMAALHAAQKDSADLAEIIMRKHPAEIARLREAASHLDEMLLRFAFDAGALDEDTVSGLGIDPWGVLADFRSAFGLAPTMSPEEWQARAALDGKEGT